VLRFNFRGVGTSDGTFDDGPGEMADFRAALDVVAMRYPGVEIWAAGFSFGSWIAMTVGAGDDRVSALIGIAPPVGHYDFSAVTNSLKPKFFIQGNRDELCPYRETTKFYAQSSFPPRAPLLAGPLAVPSARYVPTSWPPLPSQPPCAVPPASTRLWLTTSSLAARCRRRSRD
jgi:hypothetical protein